MKSTMTLLLLLLTLAGCSAPPLPPPLPARLVDQDVAPARAYARVHDILHSMHGEVLYADPDTGVLLATVRQATLYIKVTPWNDGTCGVYVRGRGTGSAVEDYANRLQKER